MLALPIRPLALTAMETMRCTLLKFTKLDMTVITIRDG
jgi:hypothetical protein